MIAEGCDILLDVNQVFVRQGENKLITQKYVFKRYLIWMPINKI